MAAVSITTGVVSQLVVLVLRKLGSAAVTKVVEILRVKDELMKLESTLTSINAVLRDAEEQQCTNNSVRLWVLNLKDVVYDIEDVLDLISTESLQNSEKRKFCGIRFSKPDSRIRLAQDLKSINTRLIEISGNRRNYKFEIHQAHPIEVIADHRETCSLVLESHTFGREEEKEAIVNNLLNSSIDGAKNISVIPITGMGGLGKTTLAQIVFNDARVVQYFNLRHWVYVSKNSSLKSVLAKMVELGYSRDFSNSTLQVLQLMLEAILKNKTLLIVLDNLGIEELKGWWPELIKLLSKGARSNIIYTTREDNFVIDPGTAKPCKLKYLSNSDCWCIFKKHAFHEGEDKHYPILVEIGKSIVGKCGGIPLAVKTLGSSLRNKRDANAWRRIAESQLWKIHQEKNDILPVLKLSLDHTPYQFRSCFTFCSLFGKGYPFYRVEMIYLWMAHGFLEVEEESEDPVDVGNKYFDELLSRSFLQLPCVEKQVMSLVEHYNRLKGRVNLPQISDEDAISQAFRGFDGKVTCTEMHNVVHDLAAYVAGEEMASVHIRVSEISARVKHLVWEAEDLTDEYFPDVLLNASKARSFAFVFPMGSVSKLFVHKIMSNFKCLRVLLLLHCELEELPDSLGNLKLLRYLDLSRSSKLKLLPDTIRKLVNLQVLQLEFCCKLITLPEGVSYLVNLKRLVLTSHLDCFPGRCHQGWRTIQVLKITICPNLASLPSELGSLISLRILVIRECPKLTSISNSIANLSNLLHLTIHSCDTLDLTGWEGLHGLNNLKFLLIFGLPKLIEFPDGIKSASRSLQYFRISMCTGLRSLPVDLYHCTCLLKLQVYNCPILSSLRGIEKLKALQELHIFGCPILGCRCVPGGEDWPLAFRKYTFMTILLTTDTLRRVKDMQVHL